jgi:hypothetical protein
MASNFAKDVWPVLRRLLAQYVRNIGALTVDAGRGPAPPDEPVARTLRPHELPFKVLLALLEALTASLASPDVAFPILPEVLPLLLPLLAPAVLPAVRIRARSAVVVLFVHDGAAVLSALYGVLEALGLGHDAVHGLVGAVEDATGAGLPAGRASEDLHVRYAAQRPPKPREPTAAYTVSPITAFAHAAAGDGSGSPAERGFLALSQSILLRADRHAAQCVPGVGEAAQDAEADEAAEAEVGDGAESESAAALLRVLRGSYRSIYSRLPPHLRAQTSSAAEVSVAAQRAATARLWSAVAVAELIAALREVRTARHKPMGYYGSHL